MPKIHPEAMPTSATGGSISLKVGLVFLFNLIVGTGALALPKSFSQAGWLLGCILIGLLAFVSYACVTFIIEALSVANAVAQRKRCASAVSKTSAMRAVTSPSGRAVISEQTRNIPSPEVQASPSISDRDLGQDRSRANTATHVLAASNLRTSELEPLLATEQENDGAKCFQIQQKIELGEIARIFYGTTGANLFFLCMFVYLTGDLAIYATSVSKTFRDLVCAEVTQNASDSGQTGPTDDSLCWSGVSLTRMDAYRIFVAVFLLCITPFTFFNLQKTKYLQMFTSFFRWTSMALMIALAIRQISLNASAGKSVQRSAADFDHFTQLFGTSVYAFMCHHSLPSIVTPIEGKQWLARLFTGTYLLVLTFYLLLSLTGMFAFESLNDLYTLNFQPNAANLTPFDGLIVFQYYLQLYPILTLSASFPIIAITLRNNIADVVKQTLKGVASRSRHLHACLYRYGNITFALLALLIPAAISICTADVGLLISITGSYPGVFIQYVIPVFLVYGARREVVRMSIGETEESAESERAEQSELRRASPNKSWYYSRRNRMLFETRRQAHVSWFFSPVWLVLVLVWAAFTIGIVTVHLIVDSK